MDLTVCDLEHPKRIHLINWNKVGPLEKIHIVSVYEQKEAVVGEVNEGETMAESFHCYSGQLSLTFLLSTAFLDFINEKLPDLIISCVEGTGRFQLYYSPEGILWLRVRKELYEKLGIQGKKEDKNSQTFLIQLNLLDEKFRNSKLRSRYIENIDRVFNGKCSFEHLFSISATNSPHLISLCKSITQIPVITSPLYQHLNLPCPLNSIPESIPDSCQVEDWNLWLGALINQCNLVTTDGVKRDPFINVCRPFAETEGPPKLVTHFHLSAPLLHPATVISYLTEQREHECRKSEKVCIVGRRRDGLGIAMYLDKSTGNILISSSTSLPENPL